MNVDVFNMDGKKVDAVELPAEIFEAASQYRFDAPGLYSPDGECPPGDAQHQNPQ